VATAGTALTEWQLKTLGRFTPDIRLSFDADAAGLAATERAIPIASKVGVSLSIISIPNGKDPDELIRNDKAAWEAIIQKPQYALDWLIDRYKNQLDISSAQGKKKFSDVLVQTIRGLNDPVEQEHYLTRISEMLGVSKEALTMKFTAVVEPIRVRLKTPPVTAKSFDKAHADMVRTQNHLLALALLRPELRPAVQMLQLQILPDEQAKQLLQVIQSDPEIVVESPALRPLEDYGKILTLLFEEVYQDVDALELSNEAVRLRDHLITQYVKTQKQRIAHELQTADPARSQQLLEAAKKLDSLLKQRKL
jgi:DNA primase